MRPAGFHVSRFDRLSNFRDVAFPFLLEREAENNLLIGLLDRIDKQSDALICVVRNDQRVVGAAIQTDPARNLLLSHMTDPCAQALADALVVQSVSLPGVHGASPAVESFAERWRCERNVNLRTGMRLGIYKLRRVIQPPPVPGYMRPAGLADLALTARWSQEFGEAVGEHPSTVDFEQTARKRIDAGEIYFWEVNAQPVSMAAATGPTPSGIRIALVYTPPPLRRRGYASGLVAMLSRKLLDSGRTFCFLFTDLANPTSNKIYQQIGYELVCHQHQILFDNPAVSPPVDS